MNLANSYWLRTTTADKDYPFSFYLSSLSQLGAGISVAPGETWTLQDTMNNIFPPASTTNVFSCKLQVFYGAEKPAEARFLLKFK
jgi:hypothetical protein